MRFAYADPPYYGCGSKYAAHHPDALVWDDLATHKALIEHLMDEFSDGWAMSCGSTQLRHMLPLCPDTVRIAAWVKPLVFFKPGVNPAYSWEPVLFHGGRKRDRTERTGYDYVSANCTFGKGLIGAKPRTFCRWIFALLNAQRGDEMVDLFPGTGIVGRAWMEWIGDKEAQREFAFRPPSAA